MNEKVAHNISEIEGQIKKLNESNSNFKKMDDITSIIQSLDPHLVCEIQNQVKVHQT